MAHSANTQFVQEKSSFIKNVVLRVEYMCIMYPLKRARETGQKLFSSVGSSDCPGGEGKQLSLLKQAALPPTHSYSYLTLSELYYCNALYMELSLTNIQTLKLIQNAATWVVWTISQYTLVTFSSVICTGFRLPSEMQGVHCHL